MDDLTPKGNDENWYSDDAEEQLRMENELLRLQLQAETGAEIQSLSELPAAVENMFLNQMLNIERQMDSVAILSIRSIIGNPEKFVDESALDDEETTLYFDELMALLEEHNIVLDFEEDYPARQKYKFLMDTFLDMEIQKFDIPELVCHFTYEEIAFEHEYRVKAVANLFWHYWFEQDIPWQKDYWRDEIVLNGVALSKQQLTTKIDQVFTAYHHFDNGHVTIDSCKVMSEGGESFAKVKGTVQYEACIDHADCILISSDFEMALVLTNDSWQIYNLNGTYSIFGS